MPAIVFVVLLIALSYYPASSVAQVPLLGGNFCFNPQSLPAVGNTTLDFYTSTPVPFQNNGFTCKFVSKCVQQNQLYVCSGSYPKNVISPRCFDFTVISWSYKAWSVDGTQSWFWGWTSNASGGCQQGGAPFFFTGTVGTTENTLGWQSSTDSNNKNILEPISWGIDYISVASLSTALAPVDCCMLSTKSLIH